LTHKARFRVKLILAKPKLQMNQRAVKLAAPVPGPQRIEPIPAEARCKERTSEGLAPATRVPSPRQARCASCHVSLSLEVINFLILGWLSDPEKPARLRRTREGQIRAVREPPVTE